MGSPFFCELFLFSSTLFYSPRKMPRAGSGRCQSRGGGRRRLPPPRACHRPARRRHCCRPLQPLRRPSPSNPLLGLLRFECARAGCRCPRCIGLQPRPPPGRPHPHPPVPLGPRLRRFRRLFRGQVPLRRPLLRLLPGPPPRRQRPRPRPRRAKRRRGCGCGCGAQARGGLPRERGAPGEPFRQPRELRGAPQGESGGVCPALPAID